MDVQLAYSRGSGPINEDAIGHCATALWVIDGATGVGGQALDAPSDAHWFAQTASRAFATILAVSPGISTPDLVLGVIDRCIAAFEAEAARHPEEHHGLPSAAFSLVRRFQTHLEFASLGDCRAMLRDSSGRITEYGQSSIAAFEARTLASVEAALAEDEALTLEALQDRVRPILIENRRSMNQPGGYWVLGLQRHAVEHLQIAEVPLQACEVAVASDGFCRLVDLFGLATPADLLAIATESELNAWMDRLRAAEQAPGSLRAFPRVKLSDDATFARVTVRG
jgi:hypothetical protein